MEIIKIISVNDINEIAKKIWDRQQNFDEDFPTSIGVVLMNYGDDEVRVKCIKQEWSGTKGDLERRDGVPLCPNGHPLFETSIAPRLGLIQLQE